MIKNYFKTAWRSLVKNRTYSSINIIGLTIGLCSCLVVATVVIDDLSYDKQWTRRDNIYRIVTINKMGEGLYDRFAASFAGLGPELKKNYPEVETYSSMWPSELQMKINETEENGIPVNTLEADTAIWQLLDIKITEGNPKKFIPGHTNLLISESFKEKYFHNQDPVGKIVYNVPAYTDKPDAYLITGVIKDLPVNSHLRAEVIMLNESKAETLNEKQFGTLNQNYVLLRPGTDIKKFTAKVNTWYKHFVSVSSPYQYEFQSIKDVYLHSSFAADQKVKGSSQNLYIFSGVALLLLLIACVNFINLSTARAATRLRETGVRKILGARRRQIIAQFLAEAILFFSLSSVLALFFYQLALKPLEIYIGHPLEQTILSRFILFASAFAFILLISVFSGIYPAWLMSGFKPANTLKGRLFSTFSSHSNRLRKSLVVLQFSISIVVLLAMIVVQQQLKFMEQTDVGFNKNNLLNIGFVSWEGKGNSFKNELMKIPAVQSASLTSWTPAQGAGFMSSEIDNPNHTGNKMTLWYISGDPDLAKTIGFRLQTGRLLNGAYSADVFSEDSLLRLDKKGYDNAALLRHCLVTATTAKLLHINKMDEPSSAVKALPVGVIQDFHNQSFRETLGPTIILAERSLNYGGMFVRIVPGNERRVMMTIQKLWKQFFPSKLLNMHWVNDLLSKQYEAENKLRQLFLFFSLLTMALASLGIFGLIVHAAQQRVKEIGVRKVLGASVGSIARLLSSDFLKLVLLAMLFAWPIAWFALNKWLQDFAYRINITWWMFAASGIAAVVIALATVSFRAIKAAMENPVKALRSE